jgi:glucose/arabinose dehydrogenase
VRPQNPDMVAKAIVPDYALGSHVAALGLTPLTRAPAAGATAHPAPTPRAEPPKSASPY